jgi:hypothetical protein
MKITLEIIIYHLSKKFLNFFPGGTRETKDAGFGKIKDNAANYHWWVTLQNFPLDNYLWSGHSLLLPVYLHRISWVEISFEKPLPRLLWNVVPVVSHSHHNFIVFTYNYVKSSAAVDQTIFTQCPFFV